MSEPKVFISYSWSNPEHEAWVLNLAEELVKSAGVDVVLDKWDLKEGHDANTFMEKMVTDEDVTKVIIVCDSVYAHKADKRTTGVGTEAQIISAEVYKKVDQNKFVAVIAEKDEDGKPYVPVFYKSRIYIDLADDDAYAKNFEQLLRWIYDKPLYMKPEKGTKPSFLDEEVGITIGTSVLYRRAIDSVKHSKSYAVGAVEEYFEMYLKNFDKFRLVPEMRNDDYDDIILKSIESIIPYRNEFLSLINIICKYNTNDSVTQFADIIHKFLEELFPFTDRPKGITSYHKCDWDNYKFIVNDIFLNIIAIALKFEKISLIEHLILKRYNLYKVNHDKKEMEDFSIFRQFIQSFENRNDRLKLMRHSIKADLTRKYACDSCIEFEYVMQADFFLYISNAIAATKEIYHQRWFPETLVYSINTSTSFELFQRAESREYFEKIKKCFLIESKDEIKLVFEGIKLQKIFIPKWQFDYVNVERLSNFENLCTKP